MQFANIKDQELGIFEIILMGLEIFRKQLRNILPIIVLITMPLHLIPVLLNNNYWIVNLAIEILLLVISLAIIIIAGYEIEGMELSWWRALKSALSCWNTYLYAEILKTATVIVFSLLIIIPGIVWIVYLYFIPQAVILRKLDASTALDYSQRVVKGKWLRVLFYIIIINILIFIPRLLFIGILGNIWSSPVLQMIYYLIREITGAFEVIVMTILFVNLEAQKGMISQLVEVPGKVETPSVP